MEQRGGLGPIIQWGKIRKGVRTTTLARDDRPGGLGRTMRKGRRTGGIGEVTEGVESRGEGGSRRGTKDNRGCGEHEGGRRVQHEKEDAGQ